MVCGQRTDFAYAHYLMSGNADRVSEPVDIPELKKRDIQADVRGIKQFVFCNLVEKAGEVFYVIHRRTI